MADQTEASQWDGPDEAFQQLKRLLEISNPEEENSGEDDGEGVINPASARASALPIVKLFPFGTYLLQIDPNLQPFACVAFGSIDTAVYVDIFWEAIAEANDGRILVYDVHEGSHNAVIELCLGKYEFKILYHQCNELLRRCVQFPNHLPTFITDLGPSYPDIISAPSSFLKNPINGCLHVCGLVETLKSDQKRLRELDMAVVRSS